jgi:hypothetical protein
VWNLAKNSKNEVELIVQKGIKEGKSAAEIQKSLKGYLNEPDKLFHRVKVTVKDKDGNIISEKLELSKAAQEYHPGRGVYRSAYKNAMRLARTEIAAAYNQAQWEAFQNDPFITGFRIVLSNNHTCINPTTGKPEPFHDMCDKLQGEYPKTFKWTLWHPQCRCTMIPISITREERKDYYKSLFDKKLDKWQPKSVITDMPKAFTEWMNENKDRINIANNRGTLPYWLKDNSALLTGIDMLKSQGVFGTIEVPNVIPTQRLDLMQIQNAMNEYATKNDLKRYAGVEYAPDGSRYYMAIDESGKIYINFIKGENGFDAGSSLVSAFDKIKRHIILSEHEEYSVEMLWHEILHGKVNKWVNLPPIKAVNTGFQRVAAETVNQLVARHTYGGFLKGIGGKPTNTDWILKNGYGYSATVSNLRKLLKATNINENLFIEKANELLVQGYTDFDKKIVELMEKMSKKNNLMDIFGCIENPYMFESRLKILNKGS